MPVGDMHDEGFELKGEIRDPDAVPALSCSIIVHVAEPTEGRKN